MTHTEEVGRVWELAPLHGFDRHAIADEMGVSYSHLCNLIDRQLHGEWRDRKRAWEAAQGPESRPGRTFRDVLDVPVPRFARPMPTPRVSTAKWRTAVVFGDSHRPFHDEKALAAVKGIIKEAKPNLVVHLGDLLDCYPISRFSTDPARLHSLQDEIDGARTFLHEVAQLAPNADRLLLGGNHEDRLRKLIWNLQGAQRQLASLRVFQRVMTWPVLLGLDEIGWDYCDYIKQPVVGRIPKLLLKHGEVVRKWSGFTAKGEWEKAARSGISGHTHRLGTFYHRDLNGSHVWNEAGCTCILDPEYVRQPDWQHGCVVVTYGPGWFHAAPVYIEKGRAVWRQREFVA